MKKLSLALLSALVLMFAFSCKEDPTKSEPILTLDPSVPIQFDSEGGTKTIAVTSNLESWNVISNQTWCKVTPLDGAKSFSITAEQYLGKDPQPAATVTVTAIDGVSKLTSTITVTQTGVAEEPFVLTVSEILPVGATVSVVPLSKTNAYHYDVIAKSSLAENHQNDLSVYMVNMMARAIEEADGNVETAVKINSSLGDQNYIFSTLIPNTDYIVFAAGLGADGKVTTRIVQQEFRTADNSVDLTFSIDVTAKYYNGFDYTLTPSSSEHRYYTTQRFAGKYRGMSNEAILKEIILEDSFMIDYFSKTGKFVYENEEMWATGATHIVVAFGWADGAPSTPLTKFEINTESVIPPAGASFNFAVSDITTRSAQVTVTPTSDKSMYLWDLIDETTYEKYKADFNSYLNDYVSEIFAKLDATWSRGESGYDFSKLLTPGTRYYSWAAYVDQNGEPMGEIIISKPFSTAPSVETQLRIRSSVDKYFNGDDLYAKDPIKYAKAQGLAYVPVVYAADAGAFPWFAVMVAEDPNDPTDNISDADMARALEAGAGIWCNVGAIYYCNWDAVHTALGVTVSKDDNYGPVMRDKYTFTKSGAAPISEFVEPSANMKPKSIQKGAKYQPKLTVYRTPSIKK